MDSSINNCGGVSGGVGIGIAGGVEIAGRGMRLSVVPSGFGRG